MSKNGSLIASEILIVDDEEDIRDLIAGILHDEGYDTRVAGDSRCARLTPSARAGRSSSCSTSGCRAPSWTASRCWISSSASSPDLPVVMISGHGTIETAVASIKKGAYDFIEKPFKADRLLHVVERALEAARLQARSAGAEAARPATRASWSASPRPSPSCAS